MNSTLLLLLLLLLLFPVRGQWYLTGKYNHVSRAADESISEGAFVDTFNHAASDTSSFLLFGGVLAIPAETVSEAALIAVNRTIDDRLEATGFDDGWYIVQLERQWVFNLFLTSDDMNVYSFEIGHYVSSFCWFRILIIITFIRCFLGLFLF